MYKFISKVQYETEELTEVGTDDEGNTVYKSRWQLSHPNARSSPDGSEYVLSNEGDLTAEEAKQYIRENW